MSATLSFHKYQGTGNDFVLLEDADGQLEFLLDRRRIALMCDRRFGIGADGLMLLQRTGGYDFRMVYYNADGAESSFCGNGSRCIVAHAHRIGWVGEEAWFVASDGDHEARVNPDGSIAVHMRSVRDWLHHGDDLVLDTGSPHYVRFLTSLPEGSIDGAARDIRYSPAWQEAGINVNFVTPIGTALHMRTYERGVEGETLSCGTGVTAAALAWAIREQPQGKSGIQVFTPGGVLHVRWEAGSYGFRDVWLEGPARSVFSGRVRLSDLEKTSDT